MRISLQDYSRIMAVGDEIITNGNAGESEEGLKVVGVVKKVMDSRNRFMMDGHYSRPGDLNERITDWSVSIPGNRGWVEVLKSVNKPEKEDKTPKVKKKIYITLEKEAMGISISLKIPEEIEEYYKSLSKGETQQSKGWFDKKLNGAVFYKLSEDALRNEKRIDSETFSDFGNGLLRDDYINTAILRTVGASKGIKITSEHFSAVNNIDLEYYIKRLGVFIKRLWETSIAKKTIKSIITYEI